MLAVLSEKEYHPSRQRIGSFDQKAMISPVKEETPSPTDRTVSTWKSSEVEWSGGSSENVDRHQRSDSFSTVGSTSESSMHVKLNTKAALHHQRNDSLSTVGSFETTSSFLPLQKQQHVSPPKMHRRSAPASASTTSSSSRPSRSSRIPPARTTSNGKSAALPLKQLKARLAVCTERYGPKHFKTAACLNQVGNHLFQLHLYPQALEMYKQAFMCEAGDHIPATYSNLGTVYWSMGELEMGVEFLQKALEVYKLNELASFGAEGSQEMTTSTSLAKARVLYQLGLCYITTNSLKKAYDCLKRCRKIQENILGMEHIEVARTLDALGRVNLLLRKYSNARQYHDRALIIKEMAVIEGQTSYCLVATYLNIARVHTATEEWTEAIRSYEQALTIQKGEMTSKLGSTNQSSIRLLEMGETLQLLGVCYRITNKTEEANKCFKEARIMYSDSGLEDSDPRMIALKRVDEV